MRNGKHAQPGDVRHKIVPFEQSTKSDGQPDFESETGDADAAGYLKGFAGRLMNIDRGLDIIFPNAFTNLDTTFKNDGVVAWQHDWSMPIGKPLMAREELAPRWGLYTEARISKTTLGTDAMILIRDKVVKKLSIGYRLLKDGYSIVNREGLVALMRGYHVNIPEDKQAEVLVDFDARKLDDVWALTKIELLEYSPVTLAMNPDADILGAKNEDLGGALDGLPFAFHPAIVATAIKGLAERIRTFKDIRAQENRKPSPAHISGLDRVVAELEEALRDAKTLQTELKAVTENPGSVSPEDGASLYAKFLALETRIVTGEAIEIPAS